MVSRNPTKEITYTNGASVWTLVRLDLLHRDRFVAHQSKLLMKILHILLDALHVGPLLLVQGQVLSTMWMMSI
jgi:hypothetical protein